MRCGNGVPVTSIINCCSTNTAASGVPPLRARDKIYPNWSRIGRLFTSEHLHQSRDRLIHVITRETMDREPRAVALDSAEGDFLVMGEFIFRHLPGFMLLVGVLIQSMTNVFLFQWSTRPPDLTIQQWH